MTQDEQYERAVTNRQIAEWMGEAREIGNKFTHEFHMQFPDYHTDLEAAMRIIPEIWNRLGFTRHVHLTWNPGGLDPATEGPWICTVFGRPGSHDYSGRLMAAQCGEEIVDASYSVDWVRANIRYIGQTPQEAIIGVWKLIKELKEKMENEGR